MADTYLQKIVTTTFTPGTPGRAGSPGQPYIPAHWETITHTVTVPTQILLGYSGGLEAGSTPTPIYGTVLTTKTVTETIWVPGQRYIPPTAPIPATPSKTVIDHNTGWNSGAISATFVTQDAKYSFQMPNGTVGVVAGLNTPQGTGYNSSTGVTHTYPEIKYAFQLAKGKYRILENGVAKTSWVSYATMDTFSVERRNRDIQYRVNGILSYASTAASTENILLADASMYWGGDYIYNSALTSTAINGGRVDSRMPRIRSASFGGFVGVIDNWLTYLVGSAQGTTLNPGTAYSKNSLPSIRILAMGGYAGAVNSYLPKMTSVSYEMPHGGEAYYSHTILPRVIGSAAGYSSIIEGVPGSGHSVNTMPSLRVSALGGFVATVDSYLPPLGVTASGTTAVTAIPKRGSVAGTLPKMVSLARGMPTGELYMALPSIGGLSGDWIYGEIRGSVPAVIGYAEGGYDAFTVSGSDFSFEPLMVAAVGITGEVGSQTVGLLPPVLGLSGARTGGAAYGEIKAALPALTGAAANDPFPYWTYIVGNPSINCTPIRIVPVPIVFDTVATIGVDPVVVKVVDVAMPITATIASTPMQAFREQSDIPISAYIDVGVFDPTATIPGLLEDVETWVVNVDTGATSQYDGFGFNSYGVYDGRYYAVSADGVYEITGRTDAGEDIASFIELAGIDFGAQQLKYVSACWVTVDSGKAMELVFSGNGKKYTYTATRSDSVMQKQRFDVGTGLKATYFSAKISNTKPFKLTAVEFLPYISKRRIR